MKSLAQDNELREGSNEGRRGVELVNDFLAKRFLRRHRLDQDSFSEGGFEVQDHKRGTNLKKCILEEKSVLLL